MHEAVEIFVNGISGVFVGLGMLYVAIKINKVMAGRAAAKKEAQT